jgi:predicted transcriptional regulator
MAKESMKDDIIIKLKRGMKPKDVADEMGVTVQYVYNLRSNLGIVGTPGKPTKKVPNPRPKPTEEQASDMSHVDALVAATRALNRAVKALVKAS